MKINKLGMFLALVMLLVIPLVSAEQQSLGIFKSGKCVELKQTCGSCTYIKITSVLYPNSSIALAPVSMTTTDNIEWTYPFCNTLQLGSYIVNGYGDVGGTDTVWAYEFEISQTGMANGSIAWIIFGIFGFACLLLVFAHSKEDVTLTMFGCFILFVLAIFTFTKGIGIFDRGELVTLMFSAVTFGIASYISVRVGIDFITN